MLIELRRRLLAAVQTAGPASLLPRGFPKLWVDRLAPSHVVATPAGESTASTGQIVFGVDLNLPADLAAVVPSWTVWSRIQSATSNTAGNTTFGPRKHFAWLDILQRYGPAAKLMLNGRRHRLMVPPELEGVDEIVVGLRAIRKICDNDILVDETPDDNLYIALHDATGDKPGVVVCEIPAQQQWCEIRTTVFSWTTTRFPFHTGSAKTLKFGKSPVITVVGKAMWDVGHAPKEQNNRRKYMPDYAVWEIHPVMKLTVQ